MSAFARLSSFLVGLMLCAPAVAEMPRRVVSINLCTDQLAMMLAAPGQLVSVSHIAADPLSSAMAEEARAYRQNHGLAEEIFALRPDLVLAGTYSNPATLALLRRLGLRVETFAPARSMADITAGIRTVAAALGRAPEGEALAIRFEADLARLTRDPANGPRTALYYANSYSLGDETLSGRILATAGLRNIGAEAGLTGGGTLPLETLVMARPDLIIEGARYARPSRSEDVLTHPALALNTARRATLADRDWICGTPHVLRAIETLQALP